MEALRALWVSGKLGIMIAIQSSIPFRVPGQMVNLDTDNFDGVAASKIWVAKTEGSGIDFLTLLGTPLDPFWECANHGWMPDTAYSEPARIIHKRTLKKARYQIYVVIPKQKDGFASPVPNATFMPEGTN